MTEEIQAENWQSMKQYRKCIYMILISILLSLSATDLPVIQTLFSTEFSNARHLSGLFAFITVALMVLWWLDISVEQSKAYAPILVATLATSGVLAVALVKFLTVSGRFGQEFIWEPVILKVLTQGFLMFSFSFLFASLYKRWVSQASTIRDQERGHQDKLLGEEECHKTV